MSNEEIFQQRKFFTEVNFTELYKRNLNKSKSQKKNDCTNSPKKFIKSFLKKIFFLFFKMIFVILLFLSFYICTEFFIQNKSCISNQKMSGISEKCIYRFIFDEWIF